MLSVLCAEHPESTTAVNFGSEAWGPQTFVSGLQAEATGHFFAGRGGDVRHDLGGGVHLTGGTTFERGGSEPEGGWLYVGL